MKSDKCKNHSFEDIRHAKLSLGIVVVLLGLLLFLKNMEIIPEPWVHYIISWQMLLVFVGLFGIIKHKGLNIFGYIVMGVGIYFMISDIYVVPYKTLQIISPLFIVFIGLIIIFKKSRKSIIPQNCMPNQDSNYFEDVRIFGGGKVIIDSQNFKGGKSFTVFGGNEINLSMANLEEGVHTIEMLAIFGGSEIIVPPEWNIKVEVAGIFGGFNDKRTIHRDLHINRKKTLIIKGLAIFGGGEIKTGS